MSNAKELYLEALERLRKRGERISLDAVANEAGKKPSAIRKDRMHDLVDAINKAAEEQADSGALASGVVAKEVRLKREYREKAGEYKERYHAALTKIASLEYQLWELRKELAKLK